VVIVFGKIVVDLDTLAVCPPSPVAVYVNVMV